MRILFCRKCYTLHNLFIIINVIQNGGGKMDNMVKYGLKMTKDESRLLEEKAKKLGMTKATIIRLLIKEYLKEL